MEHLLTPRDFFYPRVAMDFYQSMTTKQVRDPTLIHFTIDGRHGILGARHIAEALQIPYEPSHFDDFTAWTSPTELEMVHILSRGASTRLHLLRGELPPIMFLIDAFLPLLYFEEKVHKKKLQRADTIPLLFPRLLCQILEHLGYPSKPQLEQHLQPDARRASPRHIPEGIPIAALTIPRAPPRVMPFIGDPHSISSSLAQEMAAIRACQEQMLATQAQHTAILRQLQLHFDLPPAAEPSTTAMPHSHPTEPQAPSGAPTEEADPSA
ncbi:hypothetical protein CK203_034324 [Vitis vinifera]|uniref:Uncharacterized protein n=1 Tax=Vitis vinifera TaxID=29760 RepID=A0A438INH2_VITVI|nr:hypothetical protein CK203_034324 [Vitis vinifera]